ncbi:MAG: FtsX-like permease family protein [Alphaproteobacteria bacterium]|nr:FtsX-like permease family protein [Alphaproteobacteria bacterium]
MGLKPGDSLSINILGRDFTLTIASVRRFSWSSMGINFVLMVDPKTLKSAPFTYVATAQVLAQDEAGIYQKISRKFPGISIIRMKEVLNNVLDLLGKISGAINVMAMITVISGIFVLAGAIASGQQARIYDTAILKVIGATRGDILKICIIEFMLLGLITGIIAIILGTAGAYVIVKYLMEISWHLPLYIPVITVTVSAGITLAFGLISLWRALSARPSQILRAH